MPSTQNFVFIKISFSKRVGGNISPVAKTLLDTSYSTPPPETSRLAQAVFLKILENFQKNGKIFRLGEQFPFLEAGPAHEQIGKLGRLIQY
ncbi:MAG: hypothetical protein Q4C96_03585, partial [Planctomycetia bacterium]|nr:hypothetical protein [Planctomycetia bacterium]